MALHIRDHRAAQLARKLAERRGQTMTEAVIAALQSELRRDAERRPLDTRLDEIARELAAKGTPAKARRVTKDEIDALWDNG
jgi:antitoxin VapB